MAPPHIYTVTFSLTGFNTFKREGIDVPTNVSVPINAEMKVGALEETRSVDRGRVEDELCEG